MSLIAPVCSSSATWRGPSLDRRTRVTSLPAGGCPSRRRGRRRAFRPEPDSFHAELFAAGGGDEIGRPRRIPDDFDPSVGDSGDAQDALLGVGGDGGTHTATGRGESHFHLDV